MIQIDTGLLASITTILLAIIGLAFSTGIIFTKVKRNEKDIICDRQDNRDDHKQMFQKLEEINNYIRNGKAS